MKTRLVFLPLLAGAAIALGCRATTPGADGEPADAGAPGDGAPDGGAGEGVVELGQSIEGRPYAVSAEFGTPAPPHPERCTISTVGGCRLSDCAISPLGAYDSGVPSFARSAGPLTIANPSGANVVLPYRFDRYEGAGVAFAAGDTLTVDATGDDVPAFHQTVVAPANAVLTAPVFAAGPDGGAEIDRSTDLALRWTGGEGGTVVVRVRVNDWTAHGSSWHQLECELDATPGAGWIASAGLKALPGVSRTSGVTAFLTLTPTSSVIFASGAYRIRLSALGLGTGGGSFTTRN